MSTVEGNCFLKNLYSCSEKSVLSQASIERVIEASKQYKDGLHIELEQQKELGTESILVHRKCIDKYCHKKSIQKAIGEKSKSMHTSSECENVSKPKRARRSEHQDFSFLKHCIFCGEQCDTVRDPKHPGRWRPAYVCREGEKFGSKGLKEAIYEACEKRGDFQSEHVRVRMAGVLSDPRAADVRYHVDCRASFMCPKSIQAVSHRRCDADQSVDLAFNSVVAFLADNKDIIYSVHSKYVQEGGHALTRRQLIKM